MTPVGQTATWTLRSPVSADRSFKALADLMGISGGPVDLVRLEEAPPSLHERIQAEGEPL